MFKNIKYNNLLIIIYIPKFYPYSRNPQLRPPILRTQNLVIVVINKVPISCTKHTRLIADARLKPGLAQQLHIYSLGLDGPAAEPVSSEDRRKHYILYYTFFMKTS